MRPLLILSDTVAESVEIADPERVAKVVEFRPKNATDDPVVPVVPEITLMVESSASSSMFIALTGTST